jgi:uncharacterized protein YjiS (DUF1127 family)
MAITTTPAVGPHGAGVFHRTLGGRSARVAAIRERNDARRTVAALRWLKADLLDDIGLTRGDIAKFDRRGF